VLTKVVVMNSGGNEVYVYYTFRVLQDTQK